MRTQRNTLLAGVAALALLAGTGLASAQDQSADHGGAAKMTQPHASTQSPSKSGGGQAQRQNKTDNGRGPQAGKMGQSDQAAKAGHNDKGDRSTQNERSGSSGDNGRSAQSDKMGKSDKTGKSAQSGKRGAEHNAGGQEERNARGKDSGQQNNGRTAEERRPGGSSTAQRQGGGKGDMKGLQSNASGLDVKLSDQQRTKIRESVIDVHGAPRVDHVNFDLIVGTAVPRDRIHVVPVPETLVQIEPKWRGLMYFVFKDEVVIVNPHDMKIVAVFTA